MARSRRGPRRRNAMITQPGVGIWRLGSAMTDWAVCVAGITGWTGEAVARGVRDAADLRLRSGVARSAAGGERLGAPVYATVAEALDGVDVLVDYTSHAAVGANARAAIERGVSVVVGSSGLSGDDY